MKNLYLFIFLFFIYTPVRADAVLDSAESRGARAVEKGDYQQAYKIYDAAIAEAYKQRKPGTAAFFLGNAGFCLDKLGNLKGALLRYRQALVLAGKTNDSTARADLMLNMGILLKRQSDFLSALPLLLTSSALYEKLIETDTGLADRNDHLERLASCYNTIGYLHNLLQDTALSIGFSKKALAIQVSLKKTEDAALTLDCIGEFFLQNRQYDSALAYLGQALRMKKKTGSRAQIASTLMNLGYVYDSLYQPEKAIGFFRNAHKLQRAAGDSLGLSKSCVHLAAYLQQKNQIDSAFYFVAVGLPVAQSLGLKNELCAYYDVRRKLFHQTGQYQKALADAELFIDLNRELTDKNRIQQLTGMMIKHERDENEQKNVLSNALQEAKIEQVQTRNLYLVAGSALMLVVVVVMLRFYLTNKRRKQQIEFLLRELNHRVKNNLQMLYSVMGLQKESLHSDASKSVLDENRQRIWAMMLVHRRLYSGSNTTDTDIKDYLENLVAEAVSAQGYENTLRLQMAMAEQHLQTDVAVTIGLIVNELMNNAFKYAFPGHRSPCLSISLQKNKNVLVLRFQDNGPVAYISGTKKENAFGMQLIDTLCRQIEAPYTFTYNKGTCFTLTLKIK